jgi:FKBP-type peptidyl-prolyl cis-trans isomerase
MATSQGQRIGIWVIAVVLAVGTIGSFFALILQNDNAQVDQAQAQQKQEEYNKIIQEYQAKVEAQSNELSAKYYDDFAGYAKEVSAFNASDVKSLTTRDLKTGDGEEIKEDTDYSAYYIGWNPEGKVFDQSIDGDKLKTPIDGKLELIKGWDEGVLGMKIGGVREITIPADKAYGDKGQGDLIPPHTPLKFIIMAIPSPEKIPQPDLSSLGL